MQIKRILAPDLRRLEPLLAASFGEGFSLEDELECFPEPPPSDWFYLTDGGGAPQGLIRHFPLESKLYVGELYVRPSEHRQRYLRALTAHFKQHHELPKVQLRFDFKADDTDFQGTLQGACTLLEAKTFLRYERSIQDRKARAAFSFAPMLRDKLSRVQAILAFLKTYPLETLEHLLVSEKLCVLERDGRPVAALHVEPVSPTTCEIIAFATAGDVLRQGHAKALLGGFVDHAASHYNRAVLQVNNQNNPAVRPYKASGFKLVESETEVWWYTVWDESP